MIRGGNSGPGVSHSYEAPKHLYLGKAHQAALPHLANFPESSAMAKGLTGIPERWRTRTPA
jgi:hypothetical protein